MRVLHVGKFYPPVSGGMERVVQLLCEGARTRIDSRVLVANTAAKTTHDDMHGVSVTRAASVGTIGSVAICPTFPWWLRRLSTDVMVIHEPNPMALVSHWLARPRARVVVWFHSEVVRPRWKYRMFYRPFLRRVLRLANRIVVSSPRLVECAEELQDFRNKCVVIPFGIDLSRLAETDVVRERAGAIRQQYGGPLALFVGRLVSYKGVDVLLRALVGTNMKAVLVGGGPLREDLERLTADLGLGERVAFAGEVSDDEIVAMYHACDLFVLPSVTRAEAFGVVQLEAMACGKPVISTLLPSGVPWVNQDGRTGLVVTPWDVVALRNALNRLASEPTLRLKMGSAGRLRVLQEFSIDQMIERMTALLHATRRGDGPEAAARGLQPALEHQDIRRQ